MTKFHFSLIALLVLAQVANIAEAQAIIDVFRWVVPYDGIKEVEAEIGDTIVFRWAQGQHNVFIHPTMSCDLEGAVFVGAQAGTEYTFGPEDGSDEGIDMFFACDIGNGDHCRAGQSVTVKVFSSFGNATAVPTDSGTFSGTVGSSGTTSGSGTNTSFVPIIFGGEGPVVDPPLVDVSVPEVGVAESAPEDSNTTSEFLPIDAPVDAAVPADASLVDSVMAASGGARLNSAAAVVSLAGAGLALVLV